MTQVAYMYSTVCILKWKLSVFWLFLLKEQEARKLILQTVPVYAKNGRSKVFGTVCFFVDLNLGRPRLYIFHLGLFDLN